MIPRKYRRTGDGAIASYNYTDLIQGRGVLRLYGAKTHKENGASADFILTSDAVFSSAQQGSTLITGQVAEKDGIVSCAGTNTANDIDFDATISGSPLILQGDVKIEVPIIFYLTASSGFLEVNVDATLYHVENGVETSLGTGQAYGLRSTTFGGANEYSPAIATIFFNIATQRKIKIGDIIRVNVATQAVGNARIFICHDPKDRTPTLSGTGTPPESTTMSLYLPVKIIL